MNDTPEHIRKKQAEIILSKSFEERFMMGIEMMELGYYEVKNRIKRATPDISEGELIAAIVRTFYKKDFSKTELEKICDSIIDYHHNKGNKSSILEI